MSPSRSEALAVVCPRCRAMADEPCVGKRGQQRHALHAERHGLAAQLGARAHAPRDGARVEP